MRIKNVSDSNDVLDFKVVNVVVELSHVTQMTLTPHVEVENYHEIFLLSLQKGIKG